ncbi:MAG: 5-oxoprolinase subunit PxpB [Hyphomicrobiaceae bacterium]|nr:5-oxoprolinase subunit PxpB [Hyphomicrobiaceae bacterium]
MLVDFLPPAEPSAATPPRAFDPDRHARVLALDAAVTRNKVAGVVECIVAYASLLVCYDPLATTPEALAATLRKLLGEQSGAGPRRRSWRVPVCYGGSHGPDLAEVAARCGSSADDIVVMHASACYTVAMFGFLPGFAYLAGLPDHLAVPRRATPRTRVPEGGIGIGGAQTAIGSVAGPSGWHQIGRTPVRTFAPSRQPVTFLDIGDEIHFVAIDSTRFALMAAAAEHGELVAEIIS